MALGPNQLPINGYWLFSLGVKRPGREVDHSLSFSAEVKSGRSCTSTPVICLRGAEKENVTFFNHHCHPAAEDHMLVATCFGIKVLTP